MLHVWYIYQHLPSKSPSHVGKYTSTMEHLGIGSKNSLPPIRGISAGFRPGPGSCPAGREELARALGESLCPKSLAPAGDGALEMGKTWWFLKAFQHQNMVVKWDLTIINGDFMGFEHQNMVVKWDLTILNGNFMGFEHQNMVVKWDLTILNGDTKGI